ncbi:Uncharacterised protein at_DN0108 [Pycnogonum litorale]
MRCIVCGKELWDCNRKSGVAKKYVRVMQDAVGKSDRFKVEVRLHQGSALSPFLLAAMDRLTERRSDNSLHNFTDDIERRGMRVSRSKTAKETRKAKEDLDDRA